MSRRAKNPLLRSEMCKRLVAALNQSGLSDTHLSVLLGYATPATLGAMRKGETFLDPEKLCRLGRLPFRNAVYINLHWVICGIGLPFLPIADTQENSRCADAMNELVILAAAIDTGYTADQTV